MAVRVHRGQLSPMTDHLTRRDFVTAASALAGAALLPAAATAGRAPVGAADGSEIGRASCRERV